MAERAFADYESSLSPLGEVVADRRPATAFAA
jgi:hypothetical protein